MPLRPCNPSTPAFSPVALSVTARGQGHSHHAGARDPRQALPPKAQGRTRALPGLSPSPGTQAPAPDEEQAPIQKPRGIQTELAYLRQRTRIITHHFPSALGVDDFMQRMEIALYAFGFSGDNSIAMVNLCRDEVTLTLKQKIDQVFGSSFNTNGLGGVLTCGVSGVRAGLSHAPVSKGSGKERYVFFSFPHISIDSRGRQGTISRPGRPGQSCACGALDGALADIRRTGLAAACKVPGVHEPLDPEMTILKQRLARRLRYEGVGEEGVQALDLVAMTQVAERTITDDLEYLISQTVDPARADYAVVTGVQIHSWGTSFDDDAPNLEFVAPSTIDVVTNGYKTHVDLLALPALTPRQIALLAEGPESGGGGGGGAGPARPGRPPSVCNSAGHTTLREIDPPYMYASAAQREDRMARIAAYAQALGPGAGGEGDTCSWPGWQSRLRAHEPHRADDSSIHIDQASLDMADWKVQP
ncbi:LCIB1 [Auxenochlorella protothecoides x Auxenochlorella symbiontica]